MYFESFVEGNLSDFEADPSSVRYAFNAAVSVSHLADHFFAYGQRHGDLEMSTYGKLGDYIEHLCQETDEAFRDVRSIANAYKHLYTADKFAARSSVSSTGAIESIDFDQSCEGIVAIEEDYQQHGSGDHLESRPRVVLTRKDGSKVECLPLLQGVVEYWRKTIYKNDA
jgi:hypothetical protein